MRLREKLPLSVLAAFLLTPFGPAMAQFDDSGFKQALKVKKNFYLTDGAFTGGDRTQSDFRIQAVRIAANPAGYDRVVVDFAGNELGEASKLSRPPFYMVDVDALNKRVNVTVYGKPKLDFSSQAALQSVKKTKVLSQLEFLPIVTPDRWTFTLETKNAVRAEAFELSDPARLIIDLKN